MRCADVRDNLVAFLDGELEAPERESLSAHLADCEACRRERQTLGSTGDLFGHLRGAESVTPDLAKRVLEAARTVDPWCAHIRRELVAVLDGELTDVENRPVREHLEECEDCRFEADALTRTGAALDAWRIPSGFPDLTERVFTALGKSRGRLRRLAPLAAAAAVLLLAGLASFLLLSGNGSGSGGGGEGTPPTEVLLAMDLLDSETLDLLEEDPELLDLAEQVEWLETVSDDDLALLGSLGK